MNRVQGLPPLDSLERSARQATGTSIFVGQDGSGRIGREIFIAGLANMSMPGEPTFYFGRAPGRSIVLKVLRWLIICSLKRLHSPLFRRRLLNRSFCQEPLATSSPTKAGQFI